MWTCFDKLNEGLSLLRHYLDGLDKQEILLGLDAKECGAGGTAVKELQDHFRSKNNKALYDYTTIIVSLYGYLERYIEDLIAEYLERLSGIVTAYSDLPLPIQANHVFLSLELTRKADYQKYASSLRVEDVIAKLHTCFTTPNQYQLNVEAFAQHKANFRQTIVNDTFNSCGIPGIAQALRQAEPFISFLRTEDPERELTVYLDKEDDVVFVRLNELASRRNDLAHGTPVDDILSRDILRMFVDFLGAYAEGLALVVYERLLPSMLPRSMALGAPIAVFNGEIVCVALPAGEISVGDILIAKTQDNGRPYKAGPIREIQQDHVPLNVVNGGPNIKIGMRVEFVAKENQEFYCFKTADKVFPLASATEPGAGTVATAASIRPPATGTAKSSADRAKSTSSIPATSVAEGIAPADSQPSAAEIAVQEDPLDDKTTKTTTDTSDGTS